MSEHDQFAEMIPECLYGELSGKQAEEFRQHLAVCAECAAEIADFERIRGARRAEEDIALSDFARARVLRSAAAHQKKQSRMPALRFAAAAATLLIAISAGVFFLRSQKQDQRPAAQQASAPAAIPARSTPGAAPPPAMEKMTEKAPEQQKVAKQAPAASEGGRRDEAPVEFSQSPVPYELEPGKSSVAQPEDKLKEEENAKPAVAGTPAPAPSSPPPPAEGGGVGATKDLALDAKSAGEAESGTARSKAEPRSVAPSAAVQEQRQVDDFDRALAAAADLLKRKQTPEALAAYRKLIAQYPARKQQILESIPDTDVRNKIDVKK